MKTKKTNPERIAALKAANVKALKDLKGDPYLLDKTLTENNRKIKNLL